MTNQLPPRSLDTMSDAIAMSSPNGRMSKRARTAANNRLYIALFGESDLTGKEEQTIEEKREEKRASLLRSAKNLRDLAARGMHPRSYPKEAAKLEAEAAAL